MPVKAPTSKKWEGPVWIKWCMNREQYNTIQYSWIHATIINNMTKNLTGALFSRLEQSSGQIWARYPAENACWKSDSSSSSIIESGSTAYQPFLDRFDRLFRWKWSQFGSNARTKTHSLHTTLCVFNLAELFQPGSRIYRVKLFECFRIDQEDFLPRRFYNSFTHCKPKFKHLFHPVSHETRRGQFSILCTRATAVEADGNLATLFIPRS